MDTVVVTAEKGRVTIRTSIEPTGVGLAIDVIGDDSGYASLTLDELDKLTNHLIELRGERRIQALLEQP